MRRTVKTNKAFELLKEFAHEPIQVQAVDELYYMALKHEVDENQVVATLISGLYDGIRFGNWPWTFKGPTGAK